MLLNKISYSLSLLFGKWHVLLQYSLEQKSKQQIKPRTSQLHHDVTANTSVPIFAQDLCCAYYFH